MTSPYSLFPSFRFNLDHAKKQSESQHVKRKDYGDERYSARAKPRLKDCIGWVTRANENLHDLTWTIAPSYRSGEHFSVGAVVRTAYRVLRAVVAVAVNVEMIAEEDLPVRVAVCVISFFRI